MLSELDLKGPPFFFSREIKFDEERIWVNTSSNFNSNYTLLYGVILRGKKKISGFNFSSSRIFRKES